MTWWGIYLWIGLLFTFKTVFDPVDESEWQESDRLLKTVLNGVSLNLLALLMMVTSIVLWPIIILWGNIKNE